MKSFIAIGLILLTGPAHAVPVVPSFSMGRMTTHTETTSEVNEIIKSADYNTGYSYSVSGHNVESTSGDITVGAGSASFQIDSDTRAGWTELQMNNKPGWKITSPGEAFQYTESYTGPGVSNVTVIDRKVTTKSITDTTSIFQR